MECFIITGGSKGLGKSILKELDKSKMFAINISRTPGVDDNYQKNFILDLSKTDQVANFFSRQQIVELKERYQRFHLIINAAMIEPIRRIDKITNVEFLEHLNLNLASAIILAKDFLQFTDGLERSIVIVGSGAAKKPIQGWSLYCSTKAGIEMFTECLKEDFSCDQKTKIAYFNPGIMDTEMQQTIRSHSGADFPRLKDFVEYKKNNQLKGTDEVAKKLLETIESLWA